jgi:hypothetical protein
MILVGHACNSNRIFQTLREDSPDIFWLSVYPRSWFWNCWSRLIRNNQVFKTWLKYGPVEFKVLTAATMKSVTFWEVTLYSWVDVEEGSKQTPLFPFYGFVAWLRTWRWMWYVLRNVGGIHGVRNQNIVLSRFRGHYRRGLDWWIDILTT